MKIWVQVLGCEGCLCLFELKRMLFLLHFSKVEEFQMMNEMSKIYVCIYMYAFYVYIYTCMYVSREMFRV